MPSYTPVVGDVIRVVRAPEGEGYGPQPGCEGQVVWIYPEFHDRPDGTKAILVEFDGNWQEGHDGLAQCRTRSGWAMYCDHVELAQAKAFYLVGIIDKQEVVLDDQPTFATGKEAAIYAVKLSAERGYKVQPRRFVDANNDSWRQREKTRLTDGTYIPMPETWDLEPITDHFLHRSKEDPAMVAYTESAERGVLDRQTRTTPGRYLERFYPNLSDLEKKRYIAMVDAPDGVHFATTAEEMERVYVNGPRSCMAYKAGHGDLKSCVHPVHVYAGGDLQLAYLKDNERITARALVWPEKKIVGRIYGDSQRLLQALEADGYRYGPYLNGARIRKIFDEAANKFVLPYIDNAGAVHDPDPDDREGFFVIDSDGRVWASGTQGWGIRQKFCPRSGSWGPEDQFRFIHGPNEEWWIEANYGYFREIDRNGVREFWDANLVVNVQNHGYMLKADVEGKTFVSDYTGDTCHIDDQVVIATGQKLSKWEVSVYCRQCSGDGKYHFEWETQTIDRKVYSNAWLEANPEIRAEAERKLREAREARRKAEEEQLKRYREAEKLEMLEKAYRPRRFSYGYDVETLREAILRTEPNRSPLSTWFAVNDLADDDVTETTTAEPGAVRLAR